jgi:hypothetical protein
MKTLHLGVKDIPYAEDGGLTTGEVAKILEAKYGIMNAFYLRHKDDIHKALANSLRKHTSSILAGKPLNSNPYERACRDIDDMFKQFLTNSEIENMGIEGVPTQAALDGKSTRFQFGKNKGKLRKKAKTGVRRPSFVDSGTYRASEKSWVD